MAGPVEDKLAIQELIARYSYAIDYGDYDAWVDCFAEDGAFQGSSGGRWVGRAELKKFTERFHLRKTTDLPNVRHHVTNTLTDVEGGRARSSSYLQVIIADREGTRWYFCGRYDDSFVKVDGQWRFKERRVTRDTSPG